MLEFSRNPILNNLSVDVVGVAGMDKNAITEYIIRVTLNDLSWVVYRRYSEFRQLRKVFLLEFGRNSSQSLELKNLQYRLKSVPFPRKQWIFSKEMGIMNHRKEYLDRFLKNVVSCLFNACLFSKKSGFQVKTKTNVVSSILEDFLLIDCMTYAQLNRRGRKPLGRIKQRQEREIELEKSRSSLAQLVKQLETMESSPQDEFLSQDTSISREDEKRLTHLAKRDLYEKGLNEKDTKIIIDVISRVVDKAALRIPGAYTLLDQELVLNNTLVVNECENMINSNDLSIKDICRCSSNPAEYNLPSSLNTLACYKWHIKLKQDQLKERTTPNVGVM